MNERIQELVEQAGFARWIWQQQGSQEERLQKFAELIVRECAKSCTLQADEDDMFRKFGIKHLGVES
jgi:hypothetical protein